ncbi:hypothetical protein BH20VER1_BH20VER1_26250 [soil metagenome]
MSPAVAGVPRETSQSIKPRERDLGDLHLFFLVRILTRPTNHPRHAACVSNNESKPVRPLFLRGRRIRHRGWSFKGRETAGASRHPDRGDGGKPGAGVWVRKGAWVRFLGTLRQPREPACCPRRKILAQWVCSGRCPRRLRPSKRPQPGPLPEGLLLPRGEGWDEGKWAASLRRRPLLKPLLHKISESGGREGEAAKGVHPLRRAQRNFAEVERGFARRSSAEGRMISPAPAR